LATECNNKEHSAAFPEGLPEWFIKLFTQKHDTVLDPFMGSGTTLMVANNMQRNAIGIDIVPEYCEIVKKRLMLEKNLLYRMSEKNYEQNKFTRYSCIC
jgi:site-specific DNA-methyltransferase (adenine-specific)